MNSRPQDQAFNLLCSKASGTLSRQPFFLLLILAEDIETSGDSAERGVFGTSLKFGSPKRRGKMSVVLMFKVTRRSDAS